MDKFMKIQQKIQQSLRFRSQTIKKENFKPITIKHSKTFYNTGFKVEKSLATGELLWRLQVVFFLVNKYVGIIQGNILRWRPPDVDGLATSCHFILEKQIFLVLNGMIIYFECQDGTKEHAEHEKRKKKLLIVPIRKLFRRQKVGSK